MTHRVEHLMGMAIGVDVRDRGMSESVLDAVFGWLRWVDATFSTFKPDSQISRLNRGELALGECGAEVREVLERCELLRVETGGWFDARYSYAAVDPTGLVKGWAVDVAGELLRRAGVHSFCINAGGDVLVAGDHWRVGIQHPFVRDRLAGVWTRTTWRWPPRAATSAARTSSTRTRTRPRARGSWP